MRSSSGRVCTRARARGLGGPEWAGWEGWRRGRGRHRPSRARKGPNPRGRGEAARRVAEREPPPPFLDLSANVVECGAGWASLTASLPSAGPSPPDLRGAPPEIRGAIRGAQVPIFLPRKAAGDCGQVGATWPESPPDQGLGSGKVFCALVAVSLDFGREARLVSTARRGFQFWPSSAKPAQRGHKRR